MEYISAEEFLKQPKEVKKVFLDWWKPTIGDLYKSQNSFENCIDCCTGELISGFLIGNNKKDVIPLLVEGQLRKFIEDKTDSSMSCRFEKYENVFITDSYYIVLYDLITHKPKNTYESEKVKRIDAYWEVALEISKEKVKA